MRGKAIIIGAMGVVAAATLTAPAQNTASRPTAGSLATLVAATTRVAAERDEVALAVRANKPVTATPAAKPEEKTEVETKDTEREVTITPECRVAITHLKDLHQADVTEDARERASAQAKPAALVSDQVEDSAEAQSWRTALLAARAVCVPQPTTACKTALSNLQTLLQSLHPAESREVELRTQIVSITTDWSAVRTAFSAVQTACPERD